MHLGFNLSSTFNFTSISEPICLCCNVNWWVRKGALPSASSNRGWGTAKVTGTGGQHNLHMPPCSPGNNCGYGAQTKSPSSYAAREVTSVAITQPEQQARSCCLLCNTTACISLFKSFRLIWCFSKVALEHPRMQQNDYCGGSFSSQCSVLIFCASISQLGNKTP